MKLTAKILLFSLILVPTLAFGMEALHDEELGQVTAQAGITLTLDDFILYQSFGKVSFVDTDGGDTSHNPFPYDAVPRKQLLDLAGPAALNLEGIRVDVLRINAISPSSTVIGSQDSHFKIADSSVASTFTAKPLTIDVVDKLPCLSPGYNYMMASKNSVLPIPDPTGNNYNRIGISIGLPTIEIYMDELSMNGITVTTPNRQAVNSGSSMMALDAKGVDMVTLSGLAEFAAHKDTGLDFAWDDIRLYLKIDELRFTDTDGVKTATATGGPASLVIKDLKMDLLNINAITITDFNVLYLAAYLAGTMQLHALSTGQFPAHLHDMDNYTMLDLLDTLKSFHGQPLLIDVTRSLGLTALVLGSDQGKHYYDQLDASVGGVMIANGTMDIYTENLNIGKVTMEDPSHMAVNDGASFFPITMKGAQVDSLNGMIEISAH